MFLLFALFLQATPVNINSLSHQTPVAIFAPAEVTPVAVFKNEPVKPVATFKNEQPKPVAVLHQPVVNGIVLEPAHPTVIATFKVEK